MRGNERALRRLVHPRLLKRPGDGRASGNAGGVMGISDRAVVGIDVRHAERPLVQIRLADNDAAVCTRAGDHQCVFTV